MRRRAAAQALAEPLSSMGLQEQQTSLPDLFQYKSQGLGTWYDPTKWGSGTCGYNYEWEPKGVAGTVALNFEDFNAGGKMRSCGMCIQVWAKGDYQWNGRSGGGSLPMHWNGETFFVTNACATCPNKGDIDFALKPGQGVNPGQNGNGIWDIEWQGVACPTEHHKSPLYMLDSGDNQYWVKARPMNLHYPVVAMGFFENGEYKEGRLGPQFGFQYNPSSGPAASPLKVRLTTAIGEVLYDELPKLDKWVRSDRGISDHGLHAR